MKKLGLIITAILLYQFANAQQVTIANQNNIYEVNNQLYTSDIFALKALKAINPNATKKMLGNYKVKDKSIDYAYAHTVHKSQGGTYNYAFVDENDIDVARSMSNPDYELINQLKYVGFSRSSKITSVLSNKTSKPFKLTASLKEILDNSSFEGPDEFVAAVEEFNKICK